MPPVPVTWQEKVDMKRTMAVAVLCLAGGFAGTGCCTRVASCTAISTRNVKLREVDLDRVPARKDTVGRDMKWFISVIPLGIPSIEDAVDDALRRGGGDLMTDAVLYSRTEWFLIGRLGWEIRGTVVNTGGPQAASPAATIP